MVCSGKSELLVTIVQADLAWQNPEQNLNMFDRLLTSVKGVTDLVVLPEMFTTGFTMHGERLADSMSGKTIEWLKAKANHLQAVIAGSVIIRSEDKLYNRFLWATPAGSVDFYDKYNLFRYAGEDKVYTAGEDKKIFDLHGWRIRPFICFDLRFPVWCHNKNKEYDLAIFVANWPAVRAAHWRTLLKARAIENQAYVAGVNRVGTDDKGLDYSGDSMLIDPLGQALHDCGDSEAVATVSLSKEHLVQYRQSFPV